MQEAGDTVFHFLDWLDTQYKAGRTFDSFFQALADWLVAGGAADVSED
jgi:hypothetical protein